MIIPINQLHHQYKMVFHISGQNNNNNNGNDDLNQQIMKEARLQILISRRKTIHFLY